MNKRGQVSIFIAVGVIALIIVALIFFLRNQYGFLTPAPSFLGTQLKAVEDNVRTCFDISVAPEIKKFGEQGGGSGNLNSVLYRGRNVPFYCQNIPNNAKCANVMPTLDKINQRLNILVQEKMKECIDESLVEPRAGYSVENNGLLINTDISDGNVLVRLDYDISLTKGETVLPLEPINIIVEDTPISDLWDVSHDVVNALAANGFFEQINYMLEKRGNYIINVDKPYPHVIYKINKKDSDFEYWFAVEGEV